MRRLLVICLLACATIAAAQQANIKPQIAEWIKSFQTDYQTISGARLRKVVVNDKAKTISVYTNFVVATIPFRPETVARMKREIKNITKAAYPNYTIVIYADDKNIETLVPNAYRSEPDKARIAPTNRQPKAFVTPLSQPYSITNGLQNRNIALWSSHGWYFDQKTNRWHWQRARYFETVEDKLTTSYVLTFLLPMLENAGANVLLPHERDTQTHEIIVDNDNDNVHFGSLYCETGDDRLFASSSDGEGFAAHHTTYERGQNPFANGTYRTMRTTSSEEAFVEWIPDIPEDGDYAVSVAYQPTTSNTLAHYTVFHTGGTTAFTVNQAMGGGTWIYLGTFHFDKGLNPDFGKVVLSNQSKTTGCVVADAVRFGGGMGNIARAPIAQTDTIDTPPIVSGRPRYMEAATYWLQWAGAPTEVYTLTNDSNDYTDDIAAHGLWVNWLHGGSPNAPQSQGLKIPIDLSVGLHTDAGCLNDTVVGTLGIYSTNDGNSKKYPNGQTRQVARDFADYVTLSLVDDVRQTYCKNWTLRGLWDKPYGESRRPEVPAVLLEMFSHQNFTDMLFGLDPRFKFVACRAIYKGILKFVAQQNNTDYVVQPLPITHFAAQLMGDTVQLSWRATTDTLEPTATPDAFVVYTRTNNGGFDNGLLVHDSICRLPIVPDIIYGYKVVAVNSGGASFPSEILSVCRNSKANHTVLIVNGFERISAPESFSAGNYAGFPDWLDDAVPYGNDIAYVGAQHDFDRTHAWLDDDAPGWGASNSDFDTIAIAGNTFDFPHVHGTALYNAGFSFTSCSAKAVEDGTIALSNYKAVDWILGEQKQCRMGNDTTQWHFKTFSKAAQTKITDFCLSGGAFFASGAYIGTDLWQHKHASKADQYFATTVLKYKWRTDHATQNGQVGSVPSPYHFSGNYQFASQLNAAQYCVESPDGIEPADDKAFTIMRYKQNNISAAIAYKGVYRTVICGFPFESITNATQRDSLMQQIMRFLVE